MGEMIGYARVSSASQKLDIQVEALMKAGVSPEHLYKEKVTGTKRQGREAIEDMLSRGIRKGDTVVCTKLDRLARSTRDLHNISHTLEEKGVALKVLDQDIDTTTPAGRLFFTMLGAIAEFETAIRKDRQREGIDAALAKGPKNPFKGRPATLDGEIINSLYSKGATPAAISRKLGIARSSVYRYLKLPKDGA